MASQLRHWVRWDEPSAVSKRSRKAVCGKWIEPAEQSVQSETVTCPDCKQWLDEFDHMAF